MGNDEGVLVGRRRLDLGGKAVVERKLRLVLVDNAGKVGRCRRRHLRLSEQLPFEPDRIEIIVG